MHDGIADGGGDNEIGDRFHFGIGADVGHLCMDGRVDRENSRERLGEAVAKAERLRAAAESADVCCGVGDGCACCDQRIGYRLP